MWFGKKAINIKNLRALSREREKERRASRERSLKLERKKYQSEVRNDDITLTHDRYTRTSPIKRSQSGRILDRSTSRDKPRALSFRYSPAPATTSDTSGNANVITATTPVLAGKTARYSETHFSASEVIHHSSRGDVVDDASAVSAAISGQPPPLPARRYRQQRTSEPVLYPSMPLGTADLQKRSLQEVSYSVSIKATQ